MVAPAIKKQGVDGPVKHGHDGLGRWVIGDDGWYYTNPLRLDPPNPSFRRRRHGAPRGIYDLTIHLQIAEEKSWMPSFDGMTLKLPRLTSKAIWY